MVELAAGLGQVGVGVHQLLEFVAQSEWKQIPYVMAVPLESLVKKAAPEAQPILSSWWAYNYFFTSISPALTKLEAGLKITARPCLLPVLGVPYAERDNPLLHTILAHEVGHLVVEQGELRVPVGEADERELRSLVSESLNSIGFPPGPLMEHRVREALAHEFEERSKAWTEEVLADVLALRTLGPAYFFAFALLSVSAQIFSEPEFDHPPLRLRVEALLCALEDWRYTEVLPEPLQQAVSEWRVFADKMPMVALPPIHALVVGHLRARLGEVIKLAAESREAAALAYSPGAYAREVEVLRKRLLAGVPPDTVGDLPYQPASLAGIVNAAWEVRLAFLDELQRLVAGEEYHPGDLGQRSQAIGVLNRLTMKAVEYHGIASQWEKARGSIEG